MSQLVNRKVVLKSHPQGALKESDFEIVNDEVGEPALVYQLAGGIHAEPLKM